MQKIDNPKVFISYAWGNKDNQNNVVSFANKLISDGIDVLLDKFDVLAGNDLNYFMERSVLDSSVTNVLMLIDPEYTKKANNRSGGVGSESQIISAQVYSQVNQTKFVPIIFGRDEDGKVEKPCYLQSRYHFDLTNPDTYQEQYILLVNHLYGEESYYKEPLGSKPSFVGKKINLEHKTIVKYDILSSKNTEEKSFLFKEYLNEIKNEILKSCNDEVQSSLEEKYKSLIPVRDKYLLLIKKSFGIDEKEDNICDFLENVHNDINSINNFIQKKVGFTFLHELFIYTISYYLSIEKYKQLGDILGNNYYFIDSVHGNNITNYLEFYYGGLFSEFDQEKRNKDDKNYYSGVAQFWIENINTDFITKEQFIFGDLMCFNYSIIKCFSNTWFPLTYVYTGRFNSNLLLVKFSKKLITKKFLNKIYKMFNYDSPDELKEQIINAKEYYINNLHGGVQYFTSWDKAETIYDYTELKDIGTM